MKIPLMNFYKNVRPWGFWKPIRDKVIAKYPDFKQNNDFKRDMFNILNRSYCPDGAGNIALLYYCRSIYSSFSIPCYIDGVYCIVEKILVRKS
jgi:hypothetical protein